MFDLIADLLTTVTTILFPIFASYKALRTSDPAQLTPWLMYWVVVSLVLIFESFFSFILIWTPFYAWLRLFARLYLILPGQQGATNLYQTYVHPFLVEYESDIDKFISEAHDRAKSAGLQYAKMALEWIKVNVLGMPAKPPTPPPSRQGSYAQQLLSRFNLPSAREGLAAPAGDFYSLLVSTLQMATLSGDSREAQVEDLNASGTLIPPEIKSNDERMVYVSQQRERLRVLLQAFDREAFFLAGNEDIRHTADLTKSRSELDFEKLSSDELEGESNNNAWKAAQGGWMPWNWSTKQTPDTGTSTGVDTGH